MTRVWHVFSISNCKSYLYFDTASMSIMIYFYPSKPYKHVTEECTEWSILRIIYADDYILYKFGLKHRVMNRSYINNVFVNIGVFFTTNENSPVVWGHRCCTVIFVVRKETSYQVIKHIELSYTIFGYFSVVVVVYTKSSKPNRQTNKRWYFEASV